MRSLLLVAHHERDEVPDLLQRTARWAKAHHLVPVMRDDDRERYAEHGLAELGDASEVALVVSLGGDGTMLRAVQTVAGLAVPIIGVNLGRLSYLTDVDPLALELALDRWSVGAARGLWRIEERLMLDVSVPCAPDQPDAARRWLALNEAVIERHEPGHTLRVRVAIEGETFTSYAADALIVATPTGSTAYSMSARGPIVTPTHRALLLTAVAPHMLFDRSLVLEPTERLTLELLEPRPAVLTIDGRLVCPLQPGEQVEVAAADTAAQLVRFGTQRFHQLLKAKFGLADR